MLSDLSQESATALRARMRAHLAAAGAELRGSRVAVAQELRPGNLIRRHPVISAVVAGAAGLLVARLLMRRQRAATVSAVPATPIRDRLVAGAFSLGGRIATTLILGIIAKRVFKTKD